MKEQRGLKEKHLGQQPIWLINDAHFCYDGELSNNNVNEKNIKIPKKFTKMDQRAWEARYTLQWYS